MFSIINFSEITAETRGLVNQAYDIWRETYIPVLDPCGEKLLPEYFYRSKFMTLMHDHARVEAFLLHNIYDLNCKGVDELGYFDPVNDILKRKLKNESAKILSCEWVTVHPDLRAKFSKVSTGDVMMGLAFKVLADSVCTHAMGFSRTDNKADRMAEKFGFERLDLKILHGIECGVMVLKKENLKIHPYKKTQETIELLYQERLDKMTTKQGAA